MFNIEQTGKDVVITIEGDFNLVIINKNSTDTDIKPKYPKLLKKYNRNKDGFINYKELSKDDISYISIIIFRSFTNKELTENEFDIIDTHLLNYVKKIYND